MLNFVWPLKQPTTRADAPKLIPLSALDRYQEGAELKLFCSASAPQAGGRLHFEWRKNNGEQLYSSPSLSAAAADADDDDENGRPTTNHQRAAKPRAHLHISMMDDSSSVLRIGQLEAEDSGNYTCLARNQYGADSSTVRVNVNGEFLFLSFLLGAERAPSSIFIIFSLVKRAAADPRTRFEKKESANEMEKKDSPFSNSFHFDRPTLCSQSRTPQRTPNGCRRPQNSTAAARI